MGKVNLIHGYGGKPLPYDDSRRSKPLPYDFDIDRVLGDATNIKLSNGNTLIVKPDKNGQFPGPWDNEPKPNSKPAPVYGRPSPVTPRPTSSPQRPKAGPKANLNYQTGYNSNDQAINEGHILGRLNHEGAGPASQFSGVNDLRKSQQMNDATQIGRGIRQENAQQGMNEQVTRSELVQSGLSNMSKMYGDMTQRSIDQMSLATQLQEAMIRNRSALSQALIR